jgi:urea transporter
LRVKLAVLSVLGTVVSTLTASLSGYDKEDIRNGLYGFNGTLVGIAIGVFMEINVTSILLLISGSVFVCKGTVDEHCPSTAIAT